MGQVYAEYVSDLGYSRTLYYVAESKDNYVIGTGEEYNMGDCFVIQKSGELKPYKYNDNGSGTITIDGKSYNVKNWKSLMSSYKMDGEVVNENTIELSVCDNTVYQMKYVSGETTTIYQIKLDTEPATFTNPGLGSTFTYDCTFVDGTADITGIYDYAVLGVGTKDGENVLCVEEAAEYSGINKSGYSMTEERLFFDVTTKGIDLFVIPSDARHLRSEKMDTCDGEQTVDVYQYTDFIDEVYTVCTSFVGQKNSGMENLAVYKYMEEAGTSVFTMSLKEYDLKKNSGYTPSEKIGDVYNKYLDTNDGDEMIWYYAAENDDYYTISEYDVYYDNVVISKSGELDLYAFVNSGTDTIEIDGKEYTVDNWTRTEYIYTAGGYILDEYTMIMSVYNGVVYQYQYIHEEYGEPDETYTYQIVL